MNKFLRLASATIGVLSLGVVAFASNPTYVADEVMVKLKPNQEIAFATAKLNLGATEVERVPQIGWVRLKLNGRMTEAKAITTWKKFTFIQKADKNVIYYPHFDPNDPMIGQQWMVNRVKMREAWDLTMGDPTVSIAVIDTGVMLNHSDLIGQFGLMRDVVDDDNDPTDEGPIGHGTHVAGIIAAATDNGNGIAGTAGDCRIMPIRAGDAGFSGADLIEAITWATDNGAQVINMSLGGGFPNQAIQDACTYALNNNVFVCASAGNNGTTQKSYPAAYPGVMAVAASNPDDTRAGFSQYGTWVHVTAPGAGILSTVYTGPNNYESWDGTSMSCPVVAGIAGLVWARGGLGLSNTDVFDHIYDTCDPAPGNYVQSGRVNAFEAVLDTRIIATEETQPVSVSPYVGLNVNGDLADIIAEDSQALTMDADIIPKLGKGAGMDVVFDLTRDPLTLFNFQLNITASSSRSVTGMFWLWNNQTSRWDFKKAWPLNTGEVSKSFDLGDNLNKYINSDNEIWVRIRAHIPHRSAAAAQAFGFSLDMVGLDVDYEVIP